MFHRFLSIEHPIPAESLVDILLYLRDPPHMHTDDPHQDQALKLNPILEYCLSAREDVNEQLFQALVSYQKFRLDITLAGDEADRLPSEFSSLPSNVVDYVVSQWHELVPEAKEVIREDPLQQ